MIFNQQNQTGQKENIEIIEYWAWNLRVNIMPENMFNVQEVQVSLPDTGIDVLNKINKTYISS
jgi:hypothetical protein